MEEWMDIHFENLVSRSCEYSPAARWSICHINNICADI